VGKDFVIINILTPFSFRGRVGAVIFAQLLTYLFFIYVKLSKKILTKK
jgi:hypothetical protein